jgi:nucleoside 2-deoxyribosyltransferase
MLKSSSRALGSSRYSSALERLLDLLSSWSLSGSDMSPTVRCLSTDAKPHALRTRSTALLQCPCRYDPSMATPEAEKPLCFAIMPISIPGNRLDDYGGRRDHFLYVAEHLFKPAAEDAGYEFLAPVATHAEIIQAGIIENLWRADLVLCDISTWNPNVFYEFGIRCALNKPVAMVLDDKTGRIPFDTAMVNCHPYSSDLSIMTLKREIPTLASFMEAAKPQTENAVRRYFGIKESADRPQPESPEGAKLEVASIRKQQTSTRPTEPSGEVDTNDIGMIASMVNSAAKRQGRGGRPSQQLAAQIKEPGDHFGFDLKVAQASNKRVAVSSNYALTSAQRAMIEALAMAYYPNTEQIAILNQNGREVSTRMA